MHLSHRHPLGLLLDQPLPQTVQHIRQAQLRRHKFRQFAIYGIEVNIRFIEAFRQASSISLAAISRIRDQARMHWSLARHGRLSGQITVLPPRSKAGRIPLGNPKHQP